MISIITPVYNGEKFIADCIQNVIAQNCSNVEHIIMDGGSSDRTVEIVKQYATQYPYIRWFSEKDKGQSDAMNKGIKVAQGEIIGILNVDDYYELGVLNRVLELFKTLSEPALLVGNCNVWDNNNQLIRYNQPKKLKITDLLLGYEINPHPINPSAYFYHKSLHKKTGPYNTEEHYVMDLDFLLKAVKFANVKHIDETWGNYREIDGTKTVEDWKTGEGSRRAKWLLKAHMKQLPPIQQSQLATTLAFYGILTWFKYKKMGLSRRLNALVGSNATC